MRKLAIFGAAFALAAAMYVYELVDAWAIWLAAGALLLSVIGRAAGLRRVGIFCLGAAVCLLWCSCYEQLFLKDAHALDETEIQAQVQIAEAPYETDYGVAAHCTLDGYEAILYADETLSSAQPGDTVSCTAWVLVETDNLYYRSDGTVLCLYAQSETQISKGEPSIPQRLRMWLQDRIDALYCAETAGLVKALLTGERAGLSYEISNALSVAGLSHAVAVSGMHISILITMVAMLCGYQPRLMALFGIPAAVLFALMTGASASVCRAAVMQILLLLAPVVRRERDDATTLAAAALLLLMQNPWCIASVSFQLSFAAVAGLMVFSAPLQERILAVRKRPGKVLRFLASGISATLSASLMTLPLTIFYFGLVSIAAPIVNLLVLWAVTGVFVLGLCACCLGPLGAAAAWVVELLSSYIIGTARVVSWMPAAAAYPQNMLLMVWAVAFYFFLAAILLFKRFPARWGLCILTAAFIACVWIPHAKFVSYPWRLTALDVGQGQCLVLQIEDYTAIIDCGGSDPQDAGEKAARYLHSAGVSHADALILTHYDEDHAGGAVQFLSRVRTDTVYLPGAEDDNETAAAIKALAQTQDVTGLVQIVLPTGQLTLYPPVSRENNNNRGLCVLMTAKEYDILITGDMDAYAEMRLMSRWELPDVELLVAGHHGAKSSTSQVLLDKLRPETAVISVGEDNRYGHPHEETLTRLEQMGVQIYRTDLMGDLYFHP